MHKDVVMSQKNIRLEGHISHPDFVKGWVVFAHGSGSSRHSPRNNWVAKELNNEGYGTLLFDLLTSEEDETHANRFNLSLLADRLVFAIHWLKASHEYHGEPIALFGASTGAGAALIAASRLADDSSLATVISRGGRPDLAGKHHLHRVAVPVLLIVGDRDEEVIELNRQAEDELSNVQLSLVSGATHLFEEPGTLAEVVRIAGHWLERHVPSGRENEYSFS